MLTCSYCSKTSMNYSMYVIRQAVKPKGQSHRWTNVGHCCDTCHETLGKKVTYQFGEENNLC